MSTVHINIGSNKGDRHALLMRAVALIVDLMCPRGYEVSDPVVSEPWGYESPHMFMNIGLRLDIDADVTPAALYRMLVQVERLVGGADDRHRNPDGSYCDRAIDVDIIAVDRLVSDDVLTLPHPRAAQRDFVMTPLRRLDPDTAAWIESLQRG